MKFLTHYEIAKELIRKDATILFLRKTLYPVLEVTVLLREKARDQMTDIEHTILKIVGLGINKAERIAQLIGIAEHRIRPLLMEFEGRSFLSKDDANNFFLSELGKLSLSYGAELVELERSLLLCGITSKLMPQSLYGLSRISLEELSSKINIYHLIEPTNLLSLSELDISNKRSVNIPDEVVSIVTITNTTSFFLDSFLVIYKDKFGKEQTEILFPKNEKVNWINKEQSQSLPSLEPIGYAYNKSPQEIIKNIYLELTAIGIKVCDDGQLEENGSITFEIEQIDENLQRNRFHGRSLLLYLGTNKFRPIPLFTLFTKPDNRATAQQILQQNRPKDLLQGHPLNLHTINENLCQKVNILRFLENTLDSYYELPYNQRPTSAKVYIEKYLQQHNINFDQDLIFTIKSISDNRLLKALEVQ